MKQSDQKDTVESAEPSTFILIRFSEIGIKSPKTRKWLTQKLISHIEFVLKNNEIEDFVVENKFSRILVFSKHIEEIEPLLINYIPGIASISKVEKCKTDFNEITKLVRLRFLDKIQEYPTFAVKVNRTGKHSFSSVKIAADIGEFILENSEETELRVNLTKPDYQLLLDIREGVTYIFDQVSKGLGGLPAGCQGKVLTIIDGENEDVANILKIKKRGQSLLYIR